MASEIMLCPNCGGTVPEETTICPDCNEDLASLIQLEKQHIIHYNTALALAQAGDLPQAQLELATALAIRPGFYEALLLLAKIYAQRRAWPQALEAAREAQTLAPRDEQVASLIDAITDSQREARAERLLEQEQRRLARRQRAQRAFRNYERDVAAAFGVGVVVAALVALLIGWRRARRRRRSAA